MFEHAAVQIQGPPKGDVVPVFDTELLRRLLHDWRDFRVVNVADLREEVVFYLVVEPATEEGQQARLHTEIRSGVDLVG